MNLLISLLVGIIFFIKCILSTVTTNDCVIYINNTRGQVNKPSKFNLKCKFIFTQVSNDSLGIFFFDDLLLPKDSFVMVESENNNIINITNSCKKRCLMILGYFTSYTFTLTSPTKNVEFSLIYDLSSNAFHLNQNIHNFVIRKDYIPKHINKFMEINISKSCNADDKISVSSNVEANWFKIENYDLNQGDYISAESNVTIIANNFNVSEIKEDIHFYFEEVTGPCSGLYKLNSIIKSIDLTTETVDSSLIDLKCLWIVIIEEMKNAKLNLLYSNPYLSTNVDNYIIRTGTKMTSPFFVSIYKKNFDDVKNNIAYSLSNSTSLYISYTKSRGNENKKSSIIVNSSEYSGYYYGSGSFEIKNSSTLEKPYVYFQANDNMRALLMINSRGLKTKLTIYNSPILKKENILISFKPSDYLPKSIISNTRFLVLSFDSLDNFQGNFVSTVDQISMTAIGESNSFVIDNEKLSCNKSAEWYLPQCQECENELKKVIISHLILEPQYKLELNVYGKGNLEFFGENNSKFGNFPPLILYANSSQSLVYSKMGQSCPNNTYNLIESSMVMFNKNYISLDLISGQSYYITSENYPDNYSLLDEKMDISFAKVKSKSNFIYWEILDMDIMKDHSLTFNANNWIFDPSHTKNLIGDRISSNDVILKFKRYFILNKIKINDQLSGRGFKIRATPLECGGEVKNKSFVINPAGAKGDCIFIINPGDGPNSKKYINFTLSEYTKNIEIYDTNNIRNKSRAINLSGEFLLGSTAHLIVKYKATDSSKPITLTWEDKDCKDECDNRERCILPEWKCNKVNDCGDNTDEKEMYCDKNKIVKLSGVSVTVVILVIIPLAILVGIILAVYGPRVMRRFGDRYQEFHDVDTN